jgi:TRAP-type C4-dicarboxylate transport system substrate-binding protein
MRRPFRPPRLKTQKIAVAIAASIALLSGCATTTDDPDQITLVMADSFPQTHPLALGGTNEMIETLQSEKAKELGIDLEYYASGQLGDQKDMVSVLRSGVADIAPVSPAYVGPELQLSNIGDLPGYVGNAHAGASAVMDLLKPSGILYKEEWKPREIRALWAASIPHYEAMTAKRQVTTPNDLSGTTIRSTGGAADRAVDFVGAAGVSMPLGEMYEAVSRGTVDGTLASPVSVASYRLGEVLDYSTNGARLGAFTVTYAVSLNTWNQLNDQQRKFIEQASKIAQDGAADQVEKAQIKGLKQMKDEGVEFHDVTDEERPLWNAMVEPVVNGWSRDLEERGLPAKKVVSEYEAALAQYDNDEPTAK